MTTTDSGETTMSVVELGSTNDTTTTAEGPRGYVVLRRKEYQWCRRIFRGLLLGVCALIIFGCHVLFTIMVWVNHGYNSASVYHIALSTVITACMVVVLGWVHYEKGLGHYDEPDRLEFHRYQETTKCGKFVLYLFAACEITLIVMTYFVALRYNEYNTAPVYQFQNNVTMSQVPTLARSGLVLDVKDAVVHVNDYTAVPFSSTDQFLLIPVTSSSNITVIAWLISTGPSVLEAYIAIDPTVTMFTLHTTSRAEVFAYNLAYPKWQSSHPQGIVAQDAVFVDQVPVLNLNAKQSARDVLVVYFIAWGCVLAVMFLSLMMISFLLEK
jgi:hypothetical protein